MTFFKLIIFTLIFLPLSQRSLSCDDSKNMREYKAPLRYINNCADGFNVEGGKLTQLLDPNQKWLNLCIVLDRPFIDEKTLEQITKDNFFPLKENSILDYNESKVFLSLLLIVDYYKNTNPGKSMIIQVHRNSSSFPFMDMFTEILIAHYKEDCSKKHNIRENWSADPHHQGFPGFTFSNGFYLEFLNGYQDNALIPLPNFSFVFSLSWMGGLNYGDMSSTLTLPAYFVPFDVDKNIIDFCQRYGCINQLNEDLGAILNRDQSPFFPVIDRFKSPNHEKNDAAEPLTETHFRRYTTVLQISRLYNPVPQNFSDSVIIRTPSSYVKARL